MNKSMTDYFINGLLEEKTELEQYIRRTKTEIVMLQNTIELKQMNLDMINQTLEKYSLDVKGETKYER